MARWFCPQRCLPISFLPPPPVLAEHISYLNRMTSQSTKEYLELGLAQESRHLCFPQGLDGFQKDKLVCIMGQQRTTSQEVWEMAILCQYGKIGRLKTQLQLSFPLDSPHWLFPPALEGCWGSNRDHDFCPPQACLTGLSYDFIRESTKRRLLR